MQWLLVFFSYLCQWLLVSSIFMSMATSFSYIYAMATSFFYIHVMATSIFYYYVMATSFFYIYIYKLTERPVVLLNVFLSLWFWGHLGRLGFLGSCVTHTVLVLDGCMLQFAAKERCKVKALLLLEPSAICRLHSVVPLRAECWGFPRMFGG